MKTAYLVSLKYSPGLLKEVNCLGEEFSHRGWRVIYLLAGGYRETLPQAGKALFLTDGEGMKGLIGDLCRILEVQRKLDMLLEASPASFLCLYNPHPLNLLVAHRIEQRVPGCIRGIFLHEPHVQNPMLYGLRGWFRVLFALKLQDLCLKFCNLPMIPSEYSFKLFRNRYETNGKDLKLTPILLKDNFIQTGDRKFISVIGSLNPARNLKDFQKLIEFCAHHDRKLRFAIVSRSDLREFFQTLSPGGRELIYVLNEKTITDEQISFIVRSSFAVFLPHTEAAQSGNIPVAYMQGTPVIGRDIPGIAQHIRHGQTGIILSQQFSVDDFYSGVKYIVANQPSMSRDARREFLQRYSSANFERYYSFLVDQ